MWKCASLQAFCTHLKTPANRLAALAWRRSRVRVSSGPLSDAFVYAKSAVWAAAVGCDLDSFDSDRMVTRVNGLQSVFRVDSVPVMATCSHGCVKATVSKIRQGAFDLAHLRDVLDSTVPISCSRNVAETRRLLALRRRWRSMYATRRL